MNTRRLISTVLAATLAVGLGVAGAVVSSSPASAAPATCTASDAAIYAPPTAAAVGAPGSLIQCRETKLDLSIVKTAVPMKAWKVQYASTDNHGAKIAVAGVVAVPTAAWTGGGSRPVVAFNPGTLGLGSQCAFSKQLTGGYQDMYEPHNIERLLENGVAVAITDGVGYLTGQVHPYVVGLNAGHAMLDVARTAFQVPGAGLDPKTKVGLWGYSEGGHASLWAAQLAASYAPELNVAGAAAGGVPGDLRTVAKQLNGSPFAGFAIDAVIGLAASYPNLPFDSLINASGRQGLADAKKLCLAGTLARFAFAKIESFTTVGYSLDKLYELKAADGTSWGDVVDQQKLGVGIGKPGSGATYTIGFPTFQYRGLSEEVVSVDAQDYTRKAFCRAGVPTQWTSGYPAEHLTADMLAVDDVVTWFKGRFAGQPAPSNCGGF